MANKFATYSEAVNIGKGTIPQGKEGNAYVINANLPTCGCNEIEDYTDIQFIPLYLLQRAIDTHTFLRITNNTQATMRSYTINAKCEHIETSASKTFSFRETQSILPNNSIDKNVDIASIGLVDGDNYKTNINNISFTPTTYLNSKIGGVLYDNNFTYNETSTTGICIGNLTFKYYQPNTLTRTVSMWEIGSIISFVETWHGNPMSKTIKTVTFDFDQIIDDLKERSGYADVIINSIHTIKITIPNDDVQIPWHQTTSENISNEWMTFITQTTGLIAEGSGWTISEGGRTKYRYFTLNDSSQTHTITITLNAYIEISTEHEESELVQVNFETEDDGGTIFSQYNIAYEYLY